MKKPRKPAQPQTRSLVSGGHVLEESIPINLLCDMAWRIVKKEDGHIVSRAAWSHALYWADWMIREAYRVRERDELEAEIAEQEWQDRWRTRKTILEPLLTADERKAGCVEFARGCQLITGIKKKADAVQKVELAWEDFLQYPREKLDQAQLGGWRIDRVAEALVKFQGIPKDNLRKPYEKTGRFKAKYQKQKEKILEKSKKVLAGSGGKKRPKRGGISRT